MMFEAFQGRVISTASLDSLKFGGNGENPYEWLSQIDRFFTLRNLPDEQRLSLVFYHLEGEALTWFQWLEANCLLTTWINFLQMVKSRFGSTLEDLEARLAKLSQIGSVIGYQTEFEDVQSHATEVSETALDSEFLIEKGLSLDQPTTLPKSFEVGKVFERKYQNNNTKGQGWELQDVWEEIEPDVHGALTSRDLHNPSTIFEILSDPISMIKGQELQQGQKLISKEAVVNLGYKMKEFCRWWGNVSLEVFRRLVIFNLYALEEVYKDILKSPP